MRQRQIVEVSCWFQLVHTGCPTLWGDNQSGLNFAKRVSVTDNQSGTSRSVTCSDYLCHTSVNLSNSWIWNSSELHQFLQVLRCNEIRPKSQGDIFYFCIFVFESFFAISFWWIVAGIFICLSCIPDYSKRQLDFLWYIKSIVHINIS